MGFRPWPLPTRFLASFKSSMATRISSSMVILGARGCSIRYRFTSPLLVPSHRVVQRVGQRLLGEGRGTGLGGGVAGAVADPQGENDDGRGDHRGGEEPQAVAVFAGELLD